MKKSPYIRQCAKLAHDPKSDDKKDEQKKRREEKKRNLTAGIIYAGAGMHSCMRFRKIGATARNRDRKLRLFKSPARYRARIPETRPKLCEPHIWEKYIRGATIYARSDIRRRIGNAEPCH